MKTLIIVTIILLFLLPVTSSAALTTIGGSGYNWSSDANITSLDNTTVPINNRDFMVVGAYNNTFDNRDCTGWSNNNAQAGINGVWSCSNGTMSQTNTTSGLYKIWISGINFTDADIRAKIRLNDTNPVNNIIGLMHRLSDDNNWYSFIYYNNAQNWTTQIRKQGTYTTLNGNNTGGIDPLPLNTWYDWNLQSYGSTMRGRWWLDTNVSIPLFSDPGMVNAATNTSFATGYTGFYFRNPVDVDYIQIRNITSSGDVITSGNITYVLNTTGLGTNRNRLLSTGVSGTFGDNINRSVFIYISSSQNGTTYTAEELLAGNISNTTKYEIPYTYREPYIKLRYYLNGTYLTEPDINELYFTTDNLYNLSGYALDSDGNPISGVKVSNGVNITSTASNGYYSLNMTNGSHTLTFTKFAYTPAYRTSISISGSDLSNQNVTMNYSGTTWADSNLNSSYNNPLPNASRYYIYSLNISNSTTPFANKTHLNVTCYQVNCIDLRAYIDNTTLVSYWRKNGSNDGNYIKFYFNITANVSDGFQIYTGGTGLSDASDIVDTFGFGDDFENGHYSARGNGYPKWNVYDGTWNQLTVGGNWSTYLENSGDVTGISTPLVRTNNVAWEYDIRNPSADGSLFWDIGFFAIVNATGETGYYHYYNGASSLIRRNGTNLNSSTLTVDSNWHSAMVTKENNRFDAYIDGEHRNTATDNSITTSSFFFIYKQGAGVSANIDNIRARPYIYPEPEWGTWGTQNTRFSGNYTPLSNPTTKRGETQIFKINSSSNGNVTWKVNNTVIQTNNSVTTSTFLNQSYDVGTYTVLVNSTNGTSMIVNTWTWEVRSGYVHGFIIDSNNTGIGGVTISNGSYTVQSKSNGSYRLPINNGSYRLQYARLGYETDYYNIEMNGTDITDLNISLSRTNTNYIRKLIATFEETPGSIMKIDRDTLVNESVTILPDGSAINVVIVDGDYLLVTTHTTPGKIYKVYVPNMSIVANVTLNAGENFPHHIVKWKGNYYVTLQLTPGKLAKINATNFTQVATMTLTGFNSPQRFVIADVPGSVEGAAFIAGNNDLNGIGIIRVNLDTFATWGSLQFARTLFITLDNNNPNIAWAMSQDSPAIRKFDLGDFSISGTSDINNSYTNPRMIQAYGDYVYVTIKGNDPSQIVEFTKDNVSVLNRTITYPAGEILYDGLYIDSNGEIYGTADTDPAKLTEFNLTSGSFIQTVTYQNRSKAFWIASYDQLVSPPNITNWENNHTSNITKSFTINGNIPVLYNASANQTITSWTWKLNNTNQNHNFNNISFNWNTNGMRNVSVTGSNGNGSTQTIYWNVTVEIIDVTPPESVTSLQNNTGNLWHNFTWTNPSSDFNHTSIYINGTFRTNTSNQYFNLTATSRNTSTIGLRTSDILNNTNTTWINLTSIIPNNIPVQQSIGNKNIDEGLQLTITLSSTDADSDSLSYATNATKGSLVGNTFTWTPTYSDSGSYQWEFNTTDNYATDTETITITVTNIPLTINTSTPASDPTTVQGTSQTFTAGANRTANFTWMMNGTIVQTNNSVSSSTFINSTAGSNYSYNVTVNASDGIDTTFKRWNWTISPESNPDTNTTPQLINVQNSTVTATSGLVTFDVNQTNALTQVEYSINSDLSSSSRTTNASSGGSRSVNVTGLNNGTLYHYRVIAYNLSNTTLWSNSSIQNFTTNGNITLVITDYSPSSDPSTVNTTSQTFTITSNKISTMTWYDNSTLSQTNSSVLSSTFLNLTNSNIVGVHNITVYAVNGSETLFRQWNWTVTSSPIWSISGYVIDNLNSPINSATIQNGSNTTTSNSNGYYNLSGLGNGTYNLTFSKTGFNTNYTNINITGNNSNNVNISLLDTTAPAQVTGLANQTVSTTTINISWNSAATTNFYQVFRNDTHLTYTQNTYYNDTGLTQSTAYLYIVRANDTYNNWGTNSSTLTVITNTVPPTTSPPNLTSWGNTNTSNSTLLFNVEKSTTVTFNVTSNQTIATWFCGGSTKDSGDGTANANCTKSFTTTGLSQVTLYGTNPNGTSNTVTWNVTVNDTTPPDSITSLSSTPARISMTWTWTVPSDSDFSKTMLYLNGNFVENATSSTTSYTASGLSTNTQYTLSSRTVDTSGNTNSTWVNNTATTKKGASSGGGVKYTGGTSQPASYPSIVIGNGNLLPQPSSQIGIKIVLDSYDTRVEIPDTFEGISALNFFFNSKQTGENRIIITKYSSHTQSINAKLYFLIQTQPQIELTDSSSIDILSSTPIDVYQLYTDGWNKLSVYRISYDIYRVQINSIGMFAIKDTDSIIEYRPQSLKETIIQKDIEIYNRITSIDLDSFTFDFDFDLKAPEFIEELKNVIMQKDNEIYNRVVAFYNEWI